ncbi:MAG TPA: DUF2079 domain-containing protein [Candidatus Paceibacterota bacterium]
MVFWSEKKILWGIIGLYILIFGVTTAIRQYHFQTQAWDMGIFTQIFWNAAHGNGFTGTLEEIPNHFGIHFSPFFYILLPFYALFPRAYTLLWLQTIALGLGAWPLYALAKKILQDQRWAIIITVGYLLYPSLHWINFFDFHEIAFFIPLFITALYFLETAQWQWMSLFLLLAAMTREDASVFIFFAGIYALLKRQKKAGIGILIFSAIYFLISAKMIMPALGGGLLRLDRYGQFGSTASEIIKNILTRPSLLWTTVVTAEKFQYLLWSFLPVAFLPFFSRFAFLLLAPGLLENLLTRYGSQFSGLYQYDAVLIPGVFIGAMYGIYYLQKYPKQYLQYLIIGTIITGYLLRSPLNPISFPLEIFQSNPKWDSYRTILQFIPAQASVAAHTNFVPHLAQRKNIFMLGQETLEPDYLLIDATDAFGFKNEVEFNAYFDRYAESGLYEIKVFEGKYLLLGKK